MYNCDVCTTPSKPNQKVFKILIFRLTAIGRREIQKEIQACPLCHEGYHKGIPLQNLAAMNRPKPPELHQPASPTSSSGVPSAGVGTTVNDPLGGGANAGTAPLAGASYPAWFPKVLADAIAGDQARSTLPPEKRGPLANRKSSKADKLVESLEPRGKHANRPKQQKKPLVQRVKPGAKVP